MTNGWCDKVLVLGFNFESESSQTAVDLFDRIETTEDIYEGASKNLP